MKYEYECLCLGDADSIIIRHFQMLDGKEKAYIIVIDAGNIGDGYTIKKHLKTYYGTTHIDLAICTHPDKDHKDGFFELMEDEEVIVDSFWLTDPASYLDETDIKFYSSRTSAEKAVRKIWNKSNDNKRNLIDEALRKCWNREGVYSVVAGQKHSILPFHVLAPTVDLYKECAKKMVQDYGLKTYVDSDIKEFVEDAKVDDEEVKSVIDTCCDPSPYNASSLVILYEPGDGNKFLFAGDATQESLQQVVNDNKGLRDIFFLKVPHHGSRNNMTTPIIGALRPKKSYISAQGEGGHPDAALAYWLSKYGDVFSTHLSSGYLHCGHNMGIRLGSVKINPYRAKKNN